MKLNSFETVIRYSLDLVGNIFIKINRAETGKAFFVFDFVVKPVFIPSQPG